MPKNCSQSGGPALALAVVLGLSLHLTASAQTNESGNFDRPSQPATRTVPGAAHSLRDNQGHWTSGDFAQAKPGLPALVIAGDSTAATGDANHRGWGAPLVDYFDTNKVNVINRARGGRSFRSFLREQLWKQVVDALHPGDFVVIEFGHNDGGDLPGVGEETRDIAMPDGTVETVHTYGWYTRKFIRDVKGQGAIPIVSTTTTRNIWANGKVERGMGRMLEWAKQVATEENVPVVDHSNLIADRYEKLGPQAVNAFFPMDHTDTGTEGAIVNAETFLVGLKMLTNLPVAGFFNEKGLAVVNAGAAAPAGRAARPSVPMSHSPRDDQGQWTSGDFAKANPNLPSLIIAGDSTAATGDPNHRGWGAPLADYFDTNKVNVINRAIGGRSFRTFYGEQRWKAIVDALKPGDFVVIEFGHNDGGGADSPTGRGDVPGVGDETKDVTKRDGTVETVHTYGWYARTFVGEAKAKGATPILSTTTVRNIWTGDKVERGMGRMTDWLRQVAGEEKVLLLDHSNLIADRYEKMGADAVKPFFPADHTHTSTDGGVLNAEVFIAGLKTLPESPLIGFLNAKGQALLK